MSDDPVDQANRFAIVVAALVLIFCAVLIVLVAWGDAASAIGRLRDFAGYLDRHDTREAKVIVTLGATVIAMLLLALIVVEVTPSPLQKMRVRNVRAGNASITTPEIAARISAEARAVEHVQDCDAVVATHGRRIDVVLDLHVDAGADLAHTADDACGRVRELVEQRIGVELAQPPRARLHYRELRLRDEPPVPDTMRHAAPAWGPPPAADTSDEGERDGRPGNTDAPEEAQA
jgi:hypothetical protein